MPDEIRWTDTDELALALADKFPDLNPVEVRLHDLCTLVAGLPPASKNCITRYNPAANDDAWQFWPEAFLLPQGDNPPR